MIMTCVQARLQPASRCRTSTACRSAVLSRAPMRVVAFKENDEQQPQTQSQQESCKAKVTFQIPLHVEWGQEVALVGADDSLGNWDVEKSIAMSWNDGDMWTAQAELPIDTPVEYKYIVRAGEGEVKAVVQWQPCDNLALQAAAEQAELTIRDAWEGQQHEVLPGTLPLPTPPAVEEDPAAAAAAAAEGTEAAAEPAQLDAPAAAAASEDVTFSFAADPTPAEVQVLAEAHIETAAAAPAADAAAAAAEEEQAPKAAAAATGARRRSSTVSRASTNGFNKPTGGNSSRAKVVAAAATDAAPGKQSPKYGSLSTNELKEVCKERGLSAKGQRKDLLARLHQLLQGGQA